MGCNGSRLQNPELIPARFWPILRCRIVEIQRLRRLVSAKDESTKKVLLPADGKPKDIDDQKSSIGKEDNSLASSCVMSSEGGSKGKEEEGSRESKLVDDRGHWGSDSGVPDLDHDPMDDDDDVVDDNSIFYPASPSFRIYFDDNGDDSDHNDDDHGLETVKEEAVKEKIQTRDSDALPEKELGTKTEVKKVRKRRSLKKVVPRGGQAAIKNLLNIKGCYTPPCRVTRHDRALLLSDKP